MQKAGEFLLVRVKVKPRGAMRLYGRRDTPLVQANVDTAATMEMNEDSSMVRSWRRTTYRRTTRVGVDTLSSSSLATVRLRCSRNVVTPQVLRSPFWGSALDASFHNGRLVVVFKALVLEKSEPKQ